MPLGIRVSGGRGLQLQTITARGVSEVGGDISGTHVGGIGRHVGPLSPATAPMMPGREDVEHGRVGEVGAVPNEIHPWYQ